MFSVFTKLHGKFSGPCERWVEAQWETAGADAGGGVVSLGSAGILGPVLQVTSTLLSRLFEKKKAGENSFL